MRLGRVWAAGGLAAVMVAASAAVAADDRSPARDDLDKARGWLSDNPPSAAAPPKSAAGAGAKFAPPPLKFDGPSIARWVAENANLAGWVQVSFSDQGVAFVQQDKPNLSDWPMIRTQVRFESFAASEGTPYPSQRGNLQLDCDRDRLRYLSWDIYREPQLKGGRAEHAEDDSKAWSYPQPYSIERDIVVHVCDWAGSLREAR